MIATKTAVFVAALTLAGISSPLAAMAQVPEDRVDTSVREGVAGIPTGVLGRVLNELDVGVAELGPNVPLLTCENVQDFIDPNAIFSGELEEIARNCLTSSPL
jgi:hypothetical protein